MDLLDLIQPEIATLPGTKGIPVNDISGGRLLTDVGFVIVTGIRKRGPRHGALQSTP